MADKLPLVDLLKVHPWLRTKEPTDDVDMVTHKVTQKAQRDLDQLIVNALTSENTALKEQAKRIEGLLSFGEDALNMIRHGDYSNGVTGNEGTVDQGCVQAGETLGLLEKRLDEFHALTQSSKEE